LLGLAEDPRPAGVEKLANAENTYRIRQGNYRILYEIDDHARRVRVMKIGDRKDVYRR
jgi:mRNA interferase RelE/StbE